MIDVKLQLLMTVFPVPFYAAETWTVNKEEEKKGYLHLRLGVTTYFGSEMARSKN